MAKTGIEWATDVWNPVVGCTKVSSGCAHCYAERMAKRLQAMGKPEYQGMVDERGHWTGKVRMLEERLDQPYHWKKPRRVFVNSMSDLFHEEVPSDFIWQVWKVMRDNPQHIFMVLTKRAARMYSILLKDWKPYHWNIWVGVSVENQVTADERLPYLLETPAAVRFVSVEPMLRPVNISVYGKTEVDWVIAGGESGAGARAMHPYRIRDLRDQCLAAGVPFFFKQWGDYKPRAGGEWEAFRQAGYDPAEKKGGNVLDGETWMQYPE